MIEQNIYLYNLNKTYFLNISTVFADFEMHSNGSNDKIDKLIYYRAS